MPGELGKWLIEHEVFLIFLKMFLQVFIFTFSDRPNFRSQVVVQCLVLERHAMCNESHHSLPNVHWNGIILFYELCLFRLFFADPLDIRRSGSLHADVSAEFDTNSRSRSSPLRAAFFSRLPDIFRFCKFFFYLPKKCADPKEIPSLRLKKARSL